MGWPTYLLVNQPEGDFEVVGEIKGGGPGCSVGPVTLSA